MAIRLLAILLCVFAVTHLSADSSDPALPPDWYGVWSGQLTIHSTKDKSFDLPLEIEISPLKDGKSYTWKQISNFKGKKSVRNYELMSDPKTPGEFKLDEKNGIVLNVRLMGNTLYTYFKDGDILITGRYERRGESLFVELASILTKEALVSEIKAANIKIESYRLGSVQKAELKRKKE